MNKIETSRLILNEPVQDDVVCVSGLWKNEIVRTFLGGVISDENIKIKIHHLLLHWEKYRFGQYVVRDKNTRQIIGLCGPHYSDDEIEISYMFFPKFWGKGLSAEAVTACIDHSFHKLKINSLNAITQQENLRSCSLLKKAGLKHIKDFWRFDARQSLYMITKKEWELARELGVILRDSEISARLKKYQIFTFYDALKYVNELPYGRNVNLEIDCILNEGKGTCSTKHAFLRFLAQENNFPVKLMLGYYLMNQANTSQIGEILEKYNLPFILEAHCYLKFNEQVLDVTFPGEIKIKLNFDILDEQEVLPKNLQTKSLNHKKKLKKWLEDNPLYPLQDIEQLWQIREYCIQAASHHGKCDVN